MSIIIYLSKIIAYLSNLSALPAIWVGVRKKGLLWLYVLSSFVFDINSLILKQLGVNFAWSSNLFFLTEFVLLGSYFINNTLEYKIRFTARIFLTAIAIYFVVDTLYRLGLNKVNYIDTAYLYAIYILFSIVGMYKLLTTAVIESIEKSPLFVFCVAILIYASGSFIIILYENELLVTDEKFIKYAWVFIRNPLNIFKNLLICYVLMLRNNK